jgi:hypothetical protein
MGRHRSLGALLAGVLAAAAVAGAAGAGSASLRGTVTTGGGVYLRTAVGRDVVHLSPGTYRISVRDRSRRYAFRLIGPGKVVLRATGKRYVGIATWRVRLARGTYAYSSGAGSAASRGVFRVS